MLKFTEKWSSLQSQGLLLDSTQIPATSAAALDNNYLSQFYPQSLLESANSMSGFGVLPKCRLCNEEFSDNNSLKVHIQKQHPFNDNAFPYTCVICNQGFFSQRGLEYHSEKHAAKFECHLCSKTFTYSRNLKRHHELTHKLKECKYCKRLVETGDKYNQHVYSCGSVVHT